MPLVTSHDRCDDPPAGYSDEEEVRANGHLSTDVLVGVVLGTEETATTP
jgi:hypothetical protein